MSGCPNIYGGLCALVECECEAAGRRIAYVSPTDEQPKYTGMPNDNPNAGLAAISDDTTGQERVEHSSKGPDPISDTIVILLSRLSAADTRIEALERALDEIIMEATSRNHAIDIARRARAEGGE